MCGLPNKNNKNKENNIWDLSVYAKYNHKIKIEKDDQENHQFIIHQHYCKQMIPIRVYVFFVWIYNIH